VTERASRHVCVVGAGPRGLAVLEPLCVAAQAAPGIAVVVDLIDPYLFRGSDVWRTDQSGLLLMNTVAAQITMFTDDSVDLAGPVREGPSLYDWARSLALIDPVENFPAAILAEARRLGPDDYPTRGFYGNYLQWFLPWVLRTRPGNVDVVLHPRRAIGLTDLPGDRQGVTLDNGEQVGPYDAVVLALGHVVMPLESALAPLRRAAGYGHRYVPPANPADTDLSFLEPGETVLLRGMGLTFFDYLALLTEGRGGRFVGDAGGGLVYEPYGREPMLYAGSGRGVPYHARGENQKGVSGRHVPVFLTAEVLERWQRRALAGEPPSLRADIWPINSREVRGVYFRAVVRQRQDEERAAVFADLFARAGGTPAEEKLLDRYGIGHADRWDWDRLAAPWRGHDLSSPEDYQD
jgi:hypothetical protein